MLQIIFAFCLQTCTCLPWSSSAIWCSHTQLSEVLTTVVASVLTGKAYYCQQTWRSDSALPFPSWKVNKMSPSQHWCLEGHRTCSSLSWEGSIKLFLFFFSVLISVLFYESIPSHMAVQFLLQFVLRNLVKSVLKIQVCYVCWMWLLIPFKNSVRLLGQDFSSQKARLYPSKQSVYVRAQWLYVFL